MFANNINKKKMRVMVHSQVKVASKFSQTNMSYQISPLFQNNI